MSDKTDSTESKVVTISGWQRLLIWPLGIIARLWMASLRFDISKEGEAAMRKSDMPVAFIVWHNRLFIVGEVYRRFREGRKLYALVSASKDGAWLAAFFDIIGINCVRGSSSHNARESVTLLVNVMNAGHDIGITPDGPRGPIYDFKGGGMIVARRARACVILLGAEFERAWQLRSWDRFYLPRPFSSVKLKCVAIPPEALAKRSDSLETLGRKLCELNPDNSAKPHASLAV